MGEGKGNGLCLKWPWELNGQGCRLEMPWPFQALRSVGQLAVRLLNHNPQAKQATTNSPPSVPASPSNNKINYNRNGWRQLKKKEMLSLDEQGDAEERALALALATKKEATLIQFYSPRCRLCSSLAGVVKEVERRNSDWLNIVVADVENKAWLPEVLHYDIKYVPCFVLLDTYGTGLAKTGTPSSRSHVLTGLSYLLESMRPIRKSVKHSLPSPVISSTDECR